EEQPRGAARPGLEESSAAARGPGASALDFLADFLGLVRFQRQGALPMGDRLFVLTRALGEVPQMLLDRGILGIAPVGLGQILRRGFEAAEAEVDPPQRVEVSA